MGLISAANAANPEFTLDTENYSNSGFIQLEWSVERDDLADLTFEVQQSLQPEFSDSRTIYEGPDLATYVSGLPSGTYYYRVRAVNSESADSDAWSSPVQLTVEHYSQTVTFLLLGLGGIVVLTTITMVLMGSRQHLKTTTGE